MTQKVYKTARGKLVDIGSMRIQNEHVRAVGNMKVNARGDKIDSKGNVIDPINQQLQRRIERQSNVSEGPVHASLRAAQAPIAPDPTARRAPVAPPVDDTPIVPVVTLEPGTEGGLAAAIAKSKTVKQELEKTPRQQLQSQGVRKI